MKQADFNIGERLKELRTARQMTLDDAAEQTGVSKPMLGQIERGQSIPTVTTLWKIATGFKVPLSAFLEGPRADYSLVTIGAQAAVSEDDGRMRAYPIFPYDPVQNAEVFYIEFDPGCHHRSARHSSCVYEYIFVQSGTLRLVLDGNEVTVAERQAIRFRADIPHAYHTPFGTLCAVYNIIFYPGH